MSDIEAACSDLLRRGVKISEVFHGPSDVYAGPDEPYLFGRIRGTVPIPNYIAAYRSFASFSDPDGNGWLFQEITTRLPGRIEATATTFASVERSGERVSPCRDRPRRAREAHRAKRDENWPEWYAAYIVAEQVGTALPT